MVEIKRIRFLSDFELFINCVTGGNETLLVAYKRLYKRVCPSVGPSVRWSRFRKNNFVEFLSITAPAQPYATDGRVSGLVSDDDDVVCFDDGSDD